MINIHHIISSVIYIECKRQRERERERERDLTWVVILTTIWEGFPYVTKPNTFRSVVARLGSTGGDSEYSESSGSAGQLATRDSAVSLRYIVRSKGATSRQVPDSYINIYIYVCVCVRISIYIYSTGVCLRPTYRVLFEHMSHNAYTSIISYISYTGWTGGSRGRP